MTSLPKILFRASLVLCATALAVSAAAQTITTGTISRSVVDQHGGALPGTRTVTTHTDTGTTYQAVAQGDGRFTILNVRVGPYSVKATISGFKEQEQKDVVVALGEDHAVSFKLEVATVTETVTVTGETPMIDTARAGAAANISSTVKE